MATGRRRGRAIIYIALILILLLVLVFAVARFYPLGNTPAPDTAPVTDGSAPAAEPTQVQSVDNNIVVTTQDVRRGQILSDDLLAVVPVSDDQYEEGMYFGDKSEVVGARAKFDMKAHTPLNESLVVEFGTSGNMMSFEIPAGQVAISIPMSKLSSMSYGLQKGDRVNVIASLLLIDLDTNFGSKLPNRTGLVVAPGPIDETQTNVTASWISPPGYDVVSGEAFSYYGRVELDPSTNNPVFVIPNEAQRPRLVSQSLIQDVLVLQVGMYSAAPEQPAGFEDPEMQPTQQPVDENAAPVDTRLPDVVTLAVDPQDAVSLNYLMLSGASLNMVMRSAGDASRVDTEAATLQFILDQYRIPNPAKLPYGQAERLDQFPTNVQPFPDNIPNPLLESGQ